MHSCDLCQHNKSSHHSPYGDLIPLEIPSHNWDSISMDFITNLPPSHAFDTLLVVVNHLSKQAHFIPTIKSLDTSGLAQLFLSTIFKLHGLPSTIISYHHPLFPSLFCTYLTLSLASNPTLSTTY